MKRMIAMVFCMAASGPAWPNTTVKYVHTDSLGSVVAVTDPSGNVVERREYEAYGQQLTPQVQDGPGYKGHVQDAATGLAYMQQRYYDPIPGIFLSTDPVSALVSPLVQFHRYRYANNNPYRFIDPDGRRACGQNWDCRMEQQRGDVGFSAGQLRQAAKDPNGMIAEFNRIPNQQRSEAASARYFRGTGGLIQKATGREVGADIALLGGRNHTVVNYVLGNVHSVPVESSYVGPGVRVGIIHTHPGNMSFNGRNAAYDGVAWRGGFIGETDLSAAYRATAAQPTLPAVNAYVVGVDGGIQLFDMRKMAQDVHSNPRGYFNSTDYISEVE